MLFDIWSGPRFLSNYLLILNISPCIKQNYSVLYTTIHFVSKSTYYLTFSASLSRLNDGIICSLDDRPVDNDNEGVIATTILHYIQFSKILLTFIFLYKICDAHIGPSGRRNIVCVSGPNFDQFTHLTVSRDLLGAFG